jgi:putative nucleotidyltransferase with HDIG domain
VDLSALWQRFAWLRPLAETPQNPTYHAEGDVWTHLGMVLKVLSTLPAFRALDGADRHLVFAAALLHDIAKPECTKVEDDGRITSHGHSVKGVYKARRILAEDPAFGRHGTPFHTREAILSLVRWHGLPVQFPDKPDPVRAVLRPSFTTRYDLLTILADADHRGRICREPTDSADTIALFPDYCREQRVWDGPYPFANAHSRFQYFRTENAHPTLHLFDDTTCEVTMMAGLPGGGKSTWITANARGRGVVSLDDIRDELGVTPTDDQAPVITLAYERAREFLRRREDFIWNATSITRILRDKLIAIAEGYAARIQIVYVEPSIPEIRRRNSGRAKVVPESAWNRMFDRLDVPTLTEAHTVEYVLT